MDWCHSASWSLLAERAHGLGQNEQNNCLPDLECEHALTGLAWILNLDT